MKKNLRRCFLFLLPFAAGLAGWARPAQAQSVRGTVTSSESGVGLPGVNVRIKGTLRGTASDTAGRYALTVRSLQDTLVFSLLGHEPREVPIAGRTEVSVQLTAQAVALQELVVTGYRVQERGTVTGSVSSVSSAEFEDVPTDNLSNALSGRLSGVTITQNAGTPGRESSIRIRSVGTFNNADPLYVIDGVVSDKFAFDGLGSQEIANISILKDAAAASIYGSRAANGVVLVSTKRGKIGEPRFTYRGTVGTQQATRIPSSLDAYQHAKAINDALSYNKVPTSDARYYTDDELAYFQANSWNWVDAMWQDPIDTQHSLNISGGTNRVRYFLSGSLLYGSGSFENLDFQRVTSRGNIDVNLTDRLTASVDFSTEGQNRHGPSWGGNDWGQEDLYKALVLRTSMVPPYIDGLPVGNWVEWHPGVVISNVSGYDKRDWQQLNTRVRLDYKVPVIEGLSANLAYNKLAREAHQKQFNLPYDMTYFNTLGGHNHIVGDQPVGIRPRNAAEYLLNREDRNNNYQLNAQLNFQRDFGPHNIDALFVYEQAETDHIWFNGRRDNFISPTIDQFIGGSSAPENSTVNGAENQGARLSYVGSLGYNYESKYLLNGSFRYDGSVIFAPENRWGFFPAVSAGWRLSAEPFFNIGFVDDLMLRASYGVVGNDDVGSFQWLQSYDIEDGAIFASPSAGLTTGTLANRAITWEKSRSWNVGFDSRFWESRMKLSMDLFSRHTYDILGSREEAIPSTFGASLPDENYQAINAHGFEAELGYESEFGSSENPVSYYLRGNMGYATNEIVRLDEAENIRPYQSRIGRPIDAVFGYVATGILRTQADIDALPEGYTILGKAPMLGMLNYEDLRGPNSDEPDGRITSDDRAWIGNHTEPPINYGVGLGGSWKALGLDVLLQGVAGHKTMMHTNGRDLQARAEESSYGYWADSWTPDNPDGAYPGYRATSYRTRYDASSFWLRDASFLRLKNVTLSFELPQRLTKTFGANSAKLYFTGNNLAILSDHIGDWGYDPEANNIRSYPLMRTLSLGLNIAH